MINNQLIKVQVQENISPAKPSRRLIYQRIKPYMQTYGLSPEFFQIKGKSVVYKNNNPNNQSYLNRSVMSVKPSKKKPNQNISIQRPKTASLQLPNKFDLPISNKYANLFNEIKNAENKPLFQYPQRAEKSLILEEANEMLEQSLIRKHNLMLKNIAQLEMVKKEKIQELKRLQYKIDEVQNAEINSSRFIIKKNVHKQTLREKKDKAASLIQAHIKGKIYYKRYILWKKKKEEKLRKVIFIQQWWRLQMRHLKIQKQFQITHQQKQLRLIDGRTFLVITNYSYILYRIRIQLIEKMGVMKGDFRLYLNLYNYSNISQQSYEFVSLINLIINQMIKIIQIEDGDLIFYLQSQNLIEIQHMMQQVYLKVTCIIANQYSLLILKQDEAQKELLQQDKLEQIPQKPMKIEQTTEIVQIENQQEIKKQDDYIDQDISGQSNLIEQQVSIQTVELFCKNIEEFQSSETKEIIDQQPFYEDNKKVQVEIIENQEQSESQKIVNRYINLNNQSIVDIQDKELITLQTQEQQTQQNQNQYTDKELKDKQINLDDLNNDQIHQTIENQDQKINTQQNHTLIPNKEFHQQQQNISNLNNNQIQINDNNLEIQEIQEIQEISNYNSLQISNNIKMCEPTQIIQNEISLSYRLVELDNQSDQKEMQINQQDEQVVSLLQIKQEDGDLNQEDSIKNQYEPFELDQQRIIQYIQENSQMKQSQEYISEIMLDDRVVENQIEVFVQLDTKVDKPFEIQQQEKDDQEDCILISEFINQQNSNVLQQNSNALSQKIEKEPSQQTFKKKDYDHSQQYQTSQIDFHMLKSCESNVYEPPTSGKVTTKYLNSGELLSRTNFLAQLGQLENENNSLLGSGDMKKEVEGLPEPINLRKDSNNQQEQFFEPQSFLKIIPSDFRSPLMDDTLKLSTTFKFQFSSEIKVFESGQLISQQFDIKIQQQDSLEYSIDESQDLQPIYITTIRVDDDIYVDIFQIKDILKIKDKNNFYQSYDFKISKIQQSNYDYIIQNLYVYIIKNRIYCIEGNQIVKIQRYLKRFRFVQSCVLTLHKESTLICLFKSFFKIKLNIYGQILSEQEFIIEKMMVNQRKILENNFYSICPLLLNSRMGLEQMTLTTIKALEIQCD